MNTYYLRHTSRDALIAMLSARGICASASIVIDEIGVIERKTGEMMTDADGESVPVLAPICDADGNPYYHVNIYARTSLGLDANDCVDPAVPMRVIWRI